MHVQMHQLEREQPMSKSLRGGTSATRLAVATWRKSTHSGQLGNCVEAASLDSGEVALRNSRYPSGLVLIFSRDEMAAFLAGAKEGEFDDVASGSRPPATGGGCVTSPPDSAVQTNFRAPKTRGGTQPEKSTSIGDLVHLRIGPHGSLDQRRQHGSRIFGGRGPISGLSHFKIDDLGRGWGMTAVVRRV
jgi:hypothetical protein